MALGTLVEFFYFINDLKQLPRTGWLLAGVPSPESVAEHSFATTLMALALAEQINQEWAKYGLSGPLNLERVITIALVHDLAESVLTDLPKRSAELIGRDVKHAAEAKAAAALFARVPNGAHYEQLCAEYQANTTPEARLVHDADKLEMVHQALRYAQRGQQNLQEFWQGHTWHYSLSATIFEELFVNR